MTYQLIVTPVARYPVGESDPHSFEACEAMKKRILRHVDDVAEVEIVPASEAEREVK